MGFTYNLIHFMSLMTISVLCALQRIVVFQTALGVKTVTVNKSFFYLYMVKLQDAHIF